MKSSPLYQHRRSHIIVLCSAVIVTASALQSLIAQTWTGAGANNFWTTGVNWNGNVPPPNDGSANVVFFGGARTTPDLDANYSVASLVFSAGAPSYVLGSSGGFTLTIGGLISSGQATPESPRNPVIHAQTVNVALALSRDTMIAGFSSNISDFGGLTFNGPISTNVFNLNFSAPNSSASFPPVPIPINVNGVISGSGGIAAGDVNGFSSTGELVLTAANTYTGATTVSGSRQLVLTGNTAALTGTSAINLLQGAQLIVGDPASTAANPDRLNDTAALNLGRGEVIFRGSNNATTTHETIGSLRLTGGEGVLTLQTATGSTQAELASTAPLTRDPGAIALVRGTALGAAPSAGSTRLFLGATPALIGGGGAAGSTNVSIVPFLIGGTSSTDNGSTFLTYGTTGLRPLDANAEFAPSIALGAPTDNVRVTQSETVAASRTINSLVVTNPNAGSNSAITLNSGTTLRVTSGAVLLAAGYIQGGGNLDFGSAEGVMTNTGAFATSIFAPITGSSGVTFSGAGGFDLQGNNSYTGTTYLNTSVELRFGGTLGSSAPGNDVVMNDGGSLTLSSGVAFNKNIRGGTFASSPSFTVSGSDTLNGSITAAEPSPQLASGISKIVLNGGLTVTGDIVGSSSAATTLSVDASAPTTLSGAIRNGSSSAPLSLEVFGSSTNTVLNGPSTYTGTTSVIRDVTLVVNGSISGGGDVTIGQNSTSNARLGGTGVISLAAGHTVTSYGRIAPGDPASHGGVGTLTIGSFVQSNNVIALTGSSFEFQLGSTSDKLMIFGDLSLAAPNILMTISNAGDATAGLYTLIDYTGTLSGSFSNLVLQTPAGWSATLINNTSNTSIDLQVKAVPEARAGTLLLLGAAILASLRAVRRRCSEASDSLTQRS